MKRALERGDRLDLSRRGNNAVRAEAVRDLLLAGSAGQFGLVLHGARITGRLKLDFVTTTVPLILKRCVFDEPVSLFHANLPALNLDSSVLPGLNAQGLHARHFTMRNARCTGTINLIHARIDGPVVLNGASLRTGDAIALMASGMHANELSATDVLVTCDHPRGAVWLDGSRLSGRVNLSGSNVVNRSGAAVIADSTQIGRSARFEQTFLRSGGSRGALTFVNASVGSILLSGTVLRSGKGNAFCADGARIQGDIQFTDGFDARSASNDTAIRMIGTTVDGGLCMADGIVRNDAGQAVRVNTATIGESVTVAAARFEATANDAVLEISDTDVGVMLALHDTAVVNRGGDHVLDLFNTKVGRTLAIDVTGLTGATVSVNGLTYPEPPEDTGSWLAMLRDRSFLYQAQPYQQLAAVHRAAGHEHTARKVLIAQQRDLRRRGDPGNKLWHWFLGVTLGYGYKPSRAVAGLLATFVLALCLVWTTNAYNGLSPAKDRPADSCSPVNRISLAADLAIPLVKLGGTPRCELANGPAGQWATGAGWVVQILGWSFATLSVAGFTGLVRKS